MNLKPEETRSFTRDHPFEPTHRVPNPLGSSSGLRRSFLCLADASRLRELCKQTRAVSKGAVFSDPSLIYVTYFSYFLVTNYSSL